MRKWLEELPTAALMLILAYMSFEGAAWRGVMSMTIAPRSLWLVVIAVSVWQLWRAAQGKAWERTALDSVMPLWFGALLIATLGNLDQLARSGYGLWFAALYAALWYTLHNIVSYATGRLRAADALLVSAIPPLITALRQVGQVDRIAGSLENPNILSAFLVLVLPLAVARFLVPPPRLASGIGRIAFGGYVLALGVAVYFTGSRGAWLGVLAAAGIGAWIAYGQRIRAVWVVAALLPLLVLTGALLVTTRTSEPRLEIFSQAAEYFRAQPLVGNGLFTTKYYQPLADRPGFVLLHIHAHNAPLHIAAELGIVGLLALSATTFVTARVALIGWRQARDTERIIRAGSLAALVGFGAHHMVDFAVITPIVALTLIMVLIVALLPEQPTSRSARWQAAQTWLLAAVWLVLLVIALSNLAAVTEGLREAVNRGRP